MRRLDRWLRLLLLVNAAAVLVLLAAVATDGFSSGFLVLPRLPEPVASASPTPGEQLAMGNAHIPTSNSCVLCHESGGKTGLKAIPVIGHPLAGWTACLVCHTDEKLGRTAPGHTDIAQTECLNCHKVAQDGPAITQPHGQFTDRQCLDCHGKIAHLPTTMVGRNENECTLCHKAAASPPPRNPHPAFSVPGCRSCHKSADVGALPIDHALRTEDTCLLCHDVPGASGVAGNLPTPRLTLPPDPAR